MSDLNKYNRVNWIDGMKINKDHFIGLENHFTARLNDLFGQQLNYYNYGLLPIKEGSGEKMQLSLITDNQNELRVKINHCHAVTPAGFRIEITSENRTEDYFTIHNVENIYKSAADQNDEIFIVVSVDPFARVPFGEADPSAYPLRIPDIVPAYDLHLIPTKQVSGEGPGDNMLILGKINIQNNRPELVKEFIPPCTSIGSHEKLIEFYEFIYKNISILESNAVKIIYDINEKQSENVLTSIVSKITETLMHFLSNSIPGFKWFLKSQPPVFIFEFIIKIARVLKNTFDTRTAEEKEVLLNYFSEYFDIVPSRFKQLLDNTIGLTYDHNEIHSIIEKSEDFVNVISVLFNELSKMELISGKKKKEEPKRIDIILR